MRAQDFDASRLKAGIIKGANPAELPVQQPTPL
jgi:hypothetical protein